MTRAIFLDRDGTIIKDNGHISDAGDVEKIHSYILQKMKDNGIEIIEIYCCPHGKEDECFCRKPNPLFIDKAKDKYSIDILNSYVIGDHPSDVELAIKANAKGIYLLAGHGRKHYHELNDNTIHKIKICRNLKFATKTILKTENNNGT